MSTASDEIIARARDLVAVSPTRSVKDPRTRSIFLLARAVAPDHVADVSADNRSQRLLARDAREQRLRQVPYVATETWVDQVARTLEACGAAGQIGFMRAVASELGRGAPLDHPRSTLELTVDVFLHAAGEFEERAPYDVRAGVELGLALERLEAR